MMFSEKRTRPPKSTNDAINTSSIKTVATMLCPSRFSYLPHQVPDICCRNLAPIGEQDYTGFAAYL